MYGLVNQAIRDMVIGNYGESTWEEIRTRAQADDVFVGMDQYPDAMTVRLVGAASALLGAEPADVLCMFGRFWVGHIGETYEELLRMSGNDLVTFIQNLNNMHVRIAEIMPDLRPPSFTVTDLTPSSFTLHYYSDRAGLYPMVVGLIEGLGKRFHTDLQITHLRGAAEGLDHDEFAVRYGQA